MRIAAIDGPSIVYLLRADDGPVKIGTTLQSRARTRFYTIQSNNHHELSLIRAIKGSYKAEKWFQEYFINKGLQIRRDWFNFDPEMLTLQIPKNIAEIEGRLLSEYRYRTCPCCRTYFEVSTGYNTMYCSQECNTEYQKRRGHKKGLESFIALLSEC